MFLTWLNEFYSLLFHKCKEELNVTNIMDTDKDITDVHSTITYSEETSGNPRTLQGLIPQTNFQITLRIMKQEHA
jgi:hypothetical protein